MAARPGLVRWTGEKESERIRHRGDEIELARMKQYRDRVPPDSFIEIRKVLGDNVRSLRKERGFTQVELMMRADLMRPALLSEIEKNSDAVNPTLELLCRLADGLGTGVVDLLTEVKRTTKTKTTPKKRKS